jgi:hypothetical protein
MKEQRYELRHQHEAAAEIEAAQRRHIPAAERAGDCEGSDRQCTAQPEAHHPGREVAAGPRLARAGPARQAPLHGDQQCRRQ